MCVWTKKQGSMNAVVLMATPCPKSLHGKGEKWIAQHSLVCVLLKRKKAESEAQRGKPKGTLESESRNAIVE